MFTADFKAYLILRIAQLESFGLVQNHLTMDFGVIILAVFQITFYIPIFIVKCINSLIFEVQFNDLMIHRARTDQLMRVVYFWSKYFFAYYQRLLSDVLSKLLRNHCSNIETSRD